MNQYVMKNQKQLRCGVTSGTCAAAAAKAAAALLILGVRKEKMKIQTPKGITVEIPVFFSQKTEKKAEVFVVKDSGDDPDVTDQAEIYVSVEKIEETSVSKSAFRDTENPHLYLDGGMGIGRVTGKGLEQEIGQAAINKVPRAMIFEGVREICNLAEYKEPLLIIVFMPKGKELAVHTFNPQLGIEGGLSILGTTGILEPMSEKAIIDTIEIQIRQLCKQGVRDLLVTPGNYGQSYASDYLQLPMESSIKCSNYIGETIDLAAAYGMKSFLLIGDIGKLVKLAAGIMNTHSKAADGRCEIFAVHTVLCGGTGEMVKVIMNCINTEEILMYLEKWQLKEAVIQSLCGKIEEHLNRRMGGKMRFGAVLFSRRFGYLGETADAAGLMRERRGI